MTVTVTDEPGAVIAKALVLLHADRLERGNPKSFNLELRTSSEGKAEAVFPSGFYDVFVASTGFSPHCEKLRLRDGRPATLKIVLAVDKLMLDEYGDRFEQRVELGAHRRNVDLVGRCDPLRRGGRHQARDGSITI